jgi:hypothetical protein
MYASGRAEIAQITDWTTEESGFESRQGGSVHRIQTVSGAHSVFCPRSIGVSFLRIKLAGAKGDCSLPCSAEVKNDWSHSSTPPYAFMTCWLIRCMFKFYKLTKRVTYVI